MPIEDGVNWEPIDPDKRGRHETFAGAIDASLHSFSAMLDPFYDALVENWERLFPKSPLRPGRHDGDCVCLYARSAASLFTERPKLPAIRRALAALPGAPKRLQVRLEVHSC